MIEITDTSTIPDVLQGAAARYAVRPLLAVPVNSARSCASAGAEITYAAVAQAVYDLTSHYRQAGYGVRCRVGRLLEIRPDHFPH